MSLDGILSAILFSLKIKTIEHNKFLFKILLPAFIKNHHLYFVLHKHWFARRRKNWMNWNETRNQNEKRNNNNINGKQWKSHRMWFIWFVFTFSCWKTKKLIYFEFMCTATYFFMQKKRRDNKNWKQNKQNTELYCNGSIYTYGWNVFYNLSCRYPGIGTIHRV